MGKNNKVNLSRRKTLKLLGGALATTILGGGLYFLSKNGKDSKDSKINWDFLCELNIDAHEFKKHRRTSKELYIPIGKSQQIGESRRLPGIRTATLPQIKKEAYNRGWRNSNVQIGYHEQNFGKVELPELAQEHKKYIEIAISFLYENLPQLPESNLELRILKKNDDYTSNPNGKALIGSSQHSHQIAEVINKNSGEKFYIDYFSSFEGSFVHFDLKNKKKENNYIYFGSGRTSLQAPFSEIIPFATFDRFCKHMDKVGWDKASLAGEAISEGIACVLAWELAYKLKIPNGQKVVQDTMIKIIRDNAHNTYDYIGRAADWIKANGVQKGFDIYMKNPDEFLRII